MLNLSLTFIILIAVISERIECGMWPLMEHLKERYNLLGHAHAVSENSCGFMSSTLVFSI